MNNECNSLVEFDKFRLDTEKKVLWFEDKTVDMPLKAIEVLSILVESPGELVTKEEILNRVWRDSFVEENVVAQNIYRLRRLFERFGIEGELIKNVPRRGYRFLGRVTEIVAEEEFTVERETFERTFIAERFVAEEDDLSSRISQAEQRPKFIPNRNPGIPSPNRTYLFLAIGSLCLLATGAAFLFWVKADSNHPKTPVIADKIRFSRITDSGNANFPAISRDNQNIAYVRNENNTSAIILQNAATRSETVVVEPEPFEIRSLNFSADGNHLYYITREPEKAESTVYQVPIYGGTRRQIIANVRHYFSLSPDGERLAFFRYEPKKDEYHLMTCRTDGSDERIVATRKPPFFFQDWGTYPAWSPDGQKLVVSAHTQAPDENEKKSYLLEIDVGTGAEKKLGHPEWDTAYQAFWLRDGSGLVVSAREKLEEYLQLWLLSYPDGRAARITNDTNHYVEFKLAFDSNSILASKISTGSNLYTVSIEDPADVRQLTAQTLTDYGSKGVVWTMDAKSLVYVKTKGRSDGNLWKLDLETLEDQQLTFDEKSANVNPEVTPDGKSVIFQSNRTGNWHLWQIGLDGSELRQITNGTDGEMRPAISSDGRWLFYHTPGEGPTELWKMLLADGETSKILQNATGVSKPAPNDPDRIIAFFYDPVERNNMPWKYVLFSQTEKNYKDLHIETENHSFAWKRDGTGIYFPKKQINQNNLWFLSTGDNSLKKITNFKDQKILNLSVSPDDRTIAFSRYAGTSNILKINGFLPN
ncbi:MAG: winged helix-turn-helix domain-containing protein [Pyrinomonadaceae bacterium]